MGNAPVTRVKNDSRTAAQLLRQRQGGEFRRECHRRGVALQMDALLRNAAVREAPRLVEPQHFERINSTSPELRQAQEEMKNRTRSTSFRYGTLGMKILNGKNGVFPGEEMGWRDEMTHQRRPASKETRIRPPHGPESCREQQHVRDHRPDQPSQEFLFVVSTAMG